MGRGVYKGYYKGHIGKTKVEDGSKGGLDGVGRSGEKMQKTVTEQQ